MTVLGCIATLSNAYRGLAETTMSEYLGGFEGDDFKGDFNAEGFPVTPGFSVVPFNVGTNPALYATNF